MAPASSHFSLHSSDGDKIDHRFSHAAAGCGASRFQYAQPHGCYVVQRLPFRQTLMVGRARTQVSRRSRFRVGLPMNGRASTFALHRAFKYHHLPSLLIFFDYRGGAVVYPFLQCDLKTGLFAAAIWRISRSRQFYRIDFQLKRCRG